MAKRAKDLGDWQIIVNVADEDISTPLTSRRTRRGDTKQSADEIKLLRALDNTTIRKGDCILVSGEPRSVDTGCDSYHAVVIDLCTGINPHLQVLVAPLVRPHESQKSGEESSGEKDEKSDKDDYKRDKMDEKCEVTRNTRSRNTGCIKKIKNYDAMTRKTETKSNVINEKNICEELSSGFLPNELLLTSEVNEVVLKDIVETVKVLSPEKLSELDIDASSNPPVFVCCRATDRYISKISTKFDFDAWRLLLIKSSSLAIQFVAEKTSVIVSPKKIRAPPKSIEDRLKQEIHRGERKYQFFRSRDDSSSDSERDITSDSNSEVDTDTDTDSESDSDSDSEEEVLRTPRKRGRPPKDAFRGLPSKKGKSNSVQASPRKSLRELAKETDAFQQAMDVFSPRKRGFKIKSGSSIASLPSLSRGNSDLSVPTKGEKTDAFRQLKEKLHTATTVVNLPCREEQIDYVYLNLEAAVSERAGCCLYLSGTPGVGKTATVREAVRRLRESVAEGYIPEFDYLEINGLNLLSPQSTYERLYEHVSGIKVTPANAVLLLEEHFSMPQKDQKRKPLVVLVDELDQLVTKNGKVLYNLFNWPSYEHSQLVVVAVANTMDLPERELSNKVASRMGLRRYAFKGYTETELGQIIEHRLALLTETSRRQVEISVDAKRFASKKVALVSGDARRALAICRRAVEIAELEYLQSNEVEDVPMEQQAYKVRIAHIGKAISDTVNSPVAHVLASLPFAAKLVLAAVVLRIRRSGQGCNTLGDIIDEMRNQIQMLTASRTASDDASYMSLLYGDDQTGSVGAKVRINHIYQVVQELADQGILAQHSVHSDRHRLISLSVSEEEITPVLKRDRDIAAMF